MAAMNEIFTTQQASEMLERSLDYTHKLFAGLTPAEKHGNSNLWTQKYIETVRAKLRGKK